MLNEQEIFHEAPEIWFNNPAPSKMARLLASWQKDEGADYLNIRDQLFAGETVTTLYHQIKEFEKCIHGVCTICFNSEET